MFCNFLYNFHLYIDSRIFFYHNRLQGSGIRINNMNINEIYVDETQDFTQAELYLLLHICQNPNDMFLTGDTAQGIMRGISFRFKDLRSLFYHASQTTKSIKVPERVIIFICNCNHVNMYKITLFDV